MTKHLSREQLLRHLDGELSMSRAREIAKHLHACSDCALELDGLRLQLATIADAQHEVFEPSLPHPPKPWPALEPRLNKAAKANRAPLWTQVLSSLRVIVRPPLGYAGAFLALFLVVLLILGPLTPVSAKEVLNRATTADTERLAITRQQILRQRVRVTKTEQPASRVQTARLESWKSTKSAYWASHDPVNTELLHLYRENGLASDLPLSPPALNSWVKLAGSEPSASDQGARIKIRVSSNAEGRRRGLTTVSFEVQRRDWHVDEMTLSFDDATYRIDEEDSSILNRREVPDAVLAKLESREPADLGTQPPSVPRQAVTHVDLNDQEMAVRYELHKLGADLGESVEIAARPSGELVVNAAGVSPEMKEQMAASLADKPGVRLQFQAPGAHNHSGLPKNLTALPPTVEPQADERLLNFFGGAQEEENYTRSVLQASTKVLAHLYALRNLAGRWPPEEEARLSPGAKIQLAAMVRDHAREVQAGVSQFETELNPLFKNFGQPAQRQPALPGNATWRLASTSALDAMRSADQRLRSLLTVSDSPVSLDSGLPKLNQSVQDLDRSARELSTAAE